MRTTRAGLLVDRGRMVAVDAPIEPPHDGDLLVRTRFASICGSDLHIVNHGVETDPQLWAPGYPGHEGVGEVVESRSTAFTPGDRVLVVPPVAQARCFAEWQRVRASSTVRLDGGCPPLAEVLMAQQLGTVVFAARRHPTDVAGRTVAVIGQGSAGMFWAWWLKRAGASQVIVADRSPSRLAAAAHFGADVAVDARVDDLAEVVLDHTAGEGADLVVEAVGRKETLLQSISCCRTGGRLHWFGLPDTHDPVPIDFRGFFRRKLTAFSTHGAQAEPGLTSFRDALEHIRQGDIDVRPLLSHVLPAEEIEEAFRLADTCGDGVLKVSISF
ncbi:zinc-dependent alcohol dehydrogenase [Pseudonocardia sp.]|uniref:zinc-dependent alcohol dehydrogenase n=1 Tax=Pseudonocardia sp. TaxID=60912 RepID=UPI003D0E9F41